MSDPAIDPWPRRLRNLLIGIFSAAVVIGWASVSYFGRNPAMVESFNPVDGWCDAPTQGLGGHCFGDFQVPRLFLEQDSIYGPDSTGNPANPYTATAMFPHLFFRAIEWTGAGQRGSMWVYLAFLGIALLIPALWVVANRARADRDWTPVLLIGVAAGPFLTMMDRGNSAGFAVPFILLFALFVRQRPDWVAVVAVIGAASVRPQFILLALALLAFGRIRSAVVAVAVWLAISVAAFAVFPGGFAHNIRTWWGDLAQFQSQTDVAADLYTNLSASHALTVVGGWLQSAPGPLEEFGSWLTTWAVNNPNVPGAVLIVAALVTMLAAPSRRVAPFALVVALVLPVLTQSISFSYYLVVALPLAALVLGPAVPGLLTTGQRDASLPGLFSRLRDAALAVRAWAWGVLVALGLSIVPIFITGDITRQSTVKGYTGLIWLAIVIATLVLAWLPSRTTRVAPDGPVA
jgi:hypothetical protein